MLHRLSLAPSWPQWKPCWWEKKARIWSNQLREKRPSHHHSSRINRLRGETRTWCRPNNFLVFASNKEQEDERGECLDLRTRWVKEYRTFPFGHGIARWQIQWKISSHLWSVRSEGSRKKTFCVRRNAHIHSIPSSFSNLLFSLILEDCFLLRYFAFCFASRTTRNSTSSDGNNSSKNGE